MKKVINTAIAGFGLSGKAFHAPFLYVHKGFTLKKVLERHHEKSKEQYPEVKVVRNLDEILKDKEIDLVVISTPNVYHYEMVKSCIEAGKHVVIEKPLTHSYKEALELTEMAAKKNVKLFPYQNRRWDGDFLTIKKILKSGALGDIQYFEAHFDRYSPDRKRAAWRDEDFPGSGVLYDLGPHLIDQVLQLFGSPKSIEADIQAQREGSKVDDYFLITLHYPEMEAKVTAGMLVKEPGPRYIIHGHRGSYIKYGIDPQEAALRNGKMPDEEHWGEDSPKTWGLVTIDYDDDLNFNGHVETEPGNYMAFYNNVYDVMVNGKQQAVKPEQAAEVIRIIEMAFDKNKKAKQVSTSAS